MTAKIYPNLTDHNNNTSYDLTTTIRRPSENLFNIMGYNPTPSSSSYDVIRQKRPNSEDSSSSRTTGLFSSPSSSSSSPSMISVESSSDQKNGKFQSYSTSQLTSTHNNSYSHYLTPSQRYRLRKNQTEISLRNIMKNDINTWENDHIDNINEDFLWNIPSTTTYLNTLQSNDELPSVTMIPGVTPEYKNDDQYMNKMCNSLSSTYLNETKRKSHLQMNARLRSSESLPIELKQLDSMGLEDIKCVSNEKIQMMSPGRPTWLPPKSAIEIRQHKREINQQMDLMCHDELIRHQWLENYKLNIREKYTQLQKQKRGEDNKFLLKLVKEMPLPIESRFNILLSNLTKQHVETFEEISQKFSMVQFPPDKDLEITRLIQDNIMKGIFKSTTISSSLNYLLKLRSISSQGICRGDDVIIYHLLMKQMHIPDIFIFLQLIQYKIMNMVNGYETLAMKQNNKKRWENVEEDYKFNNWWNVMERIDNSDLFLWIFDLLTILSDENKCIKFMISLPMLIIKDYHYGWDSLRTLHDVKMFKVLFPGDDSTDLLYKNHHFMIKLLSLSKSI